MVPEIAVFMNINGYTGSLYEPGKIMIFRRENGQWQIDRAEDFILEADTGINHLRHQMVVALALMGECKIFVARSVSGVAYLELEKMQVSVWEINDCPENFLDEVWKREEEFSMQSAEQNTIEPPLFDEPFPGCFRICLTAIQNCKSELSTKQVLMPILARRNFYSLEILCNHLPPWLEAELKNGNYAAHVEPINAKEIKVLIMSKNCQDEYAGD